jgi:hypothetical protein
MTISQSTRNIFFSLIKYLAVFVPFTLMLLLPIFLWGDFLGIALINLFGEVYGLFLRPLVISIFYVFVLTGMLLPIFQRFSQYFWFNKFSAQLVMRIYKTYIYGITSFFVMTLLVVCLTLLLRADFWINWFNSRNYLFGYFLVVLVVAPLVALVPRRAN